MTKHNPDNLASKPLTAMKNKDLPDQAVSSIESGEINVHLVDYANIYYSLQKQEIARIKNAVNTKSEIPAKESKETILTMVDLIECFDELWPSEKPDGESVEDNTSEVNSVKLHSKIKHERNKK